MNVRTLTALRGSIEKWEKIVDGSGTEEGSQNCPLCKEFNTESNDCNGCPVKESTGRKYCRNTPFGEWCSLILRRNDCYAPRSLNSLSGELRKKAQEAAQKEVDFLKSLLPTFHSQELAKMVVELDKANAPDEGIPRVAEHHVEGTSQEKGDVETEGSFCYRFTDGKGTN